MRFGVVKVRLISADVAKTLDIISKSGMILHNLRVKDQLTAEFKIEKSHLARLNKLTQQLGDQIEVVSHEGIYWGIRHLIRRSVMVFGVLFLFILTIYLPTRVLFIEVDGNSTVPSRLILEAAGECGVGFGAKTEDVRSEKMKNALLQQIPTLQWAGINTDGCVAVISVREKTVQKQSDFRYPVSSMVASRDGYITQMTVTVGSASCKVGQSVKKGQLLISAYTDCGSHLIATKAEGEVYASTQHTVTAVSPANAVAKGQIVTSRQSFGVLFGKNLIKLSKDSGNWGQECDRIKLVYYMTIPGGFRLPFGIVTETVVFYETAETTVSEELAQSVLSQTATRHLMGQMVAGSVEKSDIRFQSQQSVYLLTGTFDCNEMICQIRTEEILQINEQGN